MNSLGISITILEFCELEELSKISRLSKTHIFSCEGRHIIKNNNIIIKHLEKKIIKIYEDDKIKNLQTNGNDLYNKVSPYMENIHKLQKYIIPLWKDNNNLILKFFRNNYISHYIKNEKHFTNMHINGSFVISIMMYLYH